MRVRLTLGKGALVRTPTPVSPQCASVTPGVGPRHDCCGAWGYARPLAGPASPTAPAGVAHALRLSWGQHEASLEPIEARAAKHLA
jgi:hypothetical protein